MPAKKISLENAKPEDYAFFSSELNEIHEKILAALYSEYTGLEEKFDKASALSKFLGEERQERVLNYAGFFEGGGIDFEDAAGSLKKIGNTLMTLLGGREIHPINLQVGGFYRLPEKTELLALKP